MSNIPLNLVKFAWFCASCIVGATLLVQLPVGAASSALVFVVMWAMLTPLLQVAESPYRFTHLGRGLLAGIAVWILGSLQNRTLGTDKSTLVMFFTIGVLAFSLGGWFVESRRERRLKNPA
jgi:hypothetical protein